MKFMTPREYAQLLFKLFFKGRTLLKETEDQNIKQIAILNIQAGLYNFIFLELCFLFVSTVLQRLEIPFDLVKAAWSVPFCIAFGFVMGGLVRSAEAVGVAAGVAVGVTAGIELDVAMSGVIGVAAASITFGVAMGAMIGAMIVIIRRDVIMESVLWGILAGFGVWGITGRIAFGVLTVISFLIMWSRWFYLPFFLIPLFKKIKLQKLPFHWDENIGAPLPFLSALLFHISKEKRQKAVDEALFLIRERPPQRKAAQRALVKIAIEEMIKFRDLKDIANLKVELDFLPRDQEAFPEFYHEGYQAISFLIDDALVALHEFNPSNRLRMLERMAGNMREFQKKMDFAKKKIGVPFGRIASRWLEIVQKEIKQIESDVGRPLPNPFIVGTPINPQSELFVGRRDIIQQIQQEVGAGAILFVGSRRTGKTSTLLNLKRYLLTSLKPVFVDCQSFSQVSYFARDITRSIHLALSNEKEKAKQCNSLDELTEFLQLIQNDLRTTNQHLLLCFDEYERLTEKIVSGEFKGLPDAFRHWIQHLPRTICLFAGSHALNEIEAIDWTDYFINVRTVRISFLDFDSALRLVTEPITRFDLQYEPNIETAKKLVRRLGCQPFLLQATMSELVNYLNTFHRKMATQADIDIAIEKLFDSQSTYFDHIWKTETSDPEKAVLQAIIKQQPMPKESDSAVRSLIRKEVLRKEDNKLVFCVPVFREWILKNQVF